LKKIHLRALVLAAGYGTRLRPLTAFVPKPLVPVRGKPVTLLTLEQLAAVGCQAIAVNLHHHGKAIRQSLGESVGGVPLTYSVEEEILGTLGALGPLQEFFRPADLVLVLNGDSLCRWPLRRLIRKHLRGGNEATLLVSKSIDPRPFGGGVTVEDRKRIVAFRQEGGENPKLQRRLFMGAHALSPAILDRLPEGSAHFVGDLYEPILGGGGSIGAVESARKWHDLGTPERYRQAVLRWGRRRGWQAADVEVAGGVAVERSVLESKVQVEVESQVKGSVILQEARIGRGCRISEAIIGPGVNLPQHTTVERRMVTPVRADTASSEAASVVGGLVYEPI
jgi:NDP-sugar pyrophosphorylase family protein